MERYIPPHLRDNAPQFDRGEAPPDVPWYRPGPRARCSEEPTHDNLFILSPTDEKLQFRTILFKSGRLIRGVAAQGERQRPAQPQHSDFHRALAGGVATSGLAGSDHGKRLREKLEPVMREALEEIARLCAATSDLQTARRVRPQLRLCFGQLNFYSVRGESWDNLPSCLFCPSDLEEEFVSGEDQTRLPLANPAKRFEAKLTERDFKKLTEYVKEYAGVSQGDGVEKEIFVVEISKDNWQEPLVCFCKVEGDRLTILKLKRREEKNLVADLSWATEWDLRLMLSARVVEGDETLSDDERKTAEDTVKRAIINLNTELGIRWPLSGANQSEADSGLVTRSVQRLRRTKISEGGIVWRFTHVISDAEGAWFHVDLRLVSWNGTLKDLHANKEQIDYSAKSKEFLDNTFVVLDWILHLKILEGYKASGLHF